MGDELPGGGRVALGHVLFGVSRLQEGLGEHPPYGPGHARHAPAHHVGYVQDAVVGKPRFPEGLHPPGGLQVVLREHLLVGVREGQAERPPDAIEELPVHARGLGDLVGAVAGSVGAEGPLHRQ
jgi:hypothetical protein